MVNLTIDGKRISLPDGTTVLQAANFAGIDIPTLCDHPHLVPYGGCRLCVVEIEGTRNLQPSCTLPIMENMVVRTNSERVLSARKFILAMLFSDRNHLCPYCVVSEGDCELQQQAYQAGMTHWPMQPEWKPYKVDASHEHIVLDQNRCILCRRCVRACSELVGVHTLGVMERGANCSIIADLDVPLGESSCVSCGVCVQVCPTGAMIDRWSAFRGQTIDLKRSDTICTGCSIGCGVTVFTKDDHLIKIDGNWAASPNHGILCKQGRFYPLDEHEKRVQIPRIRLGTEIVPISWEKAFETISAKIQPALNDEQDHIAGLISARLSIESIYLFREIFSRFPGSPSVSTLEANRQLQLSYKLAEAMGKPIETRLGSIEKADVIILLDTDLLKNHEVASFFIRRAVSKGTKLLILDTAENPLDEIATMSVRRKAETPLRNILNGMASAINIFKTPPITKQVPVHYELEQTTGETGISPDTFQAIIEHIHLARNPLIIYECSNLQEDETMLAEKIIKFARSCNAIKEDWNGLLSLKGKANGYAAGQYHLDKPVQLEGKKIVYIALGEDEPSPSLIQSARLAPFLIVQAAFECELTEAANVVLPAAIWGEEQGHYLNTNGKINKAAAFRSIKTDAKPNHVILRQLAAALELDEKCGQNWRDALLERPSLNIIEN